jgi:LmbE family N-acetylglucosaminyl deacetylase
MDVMKRLLLGVALAACVGLIPVAQLRTVPVDRERGHVALGLALRHLANTGILMMATAHPDDENNGLLVELNRGQGVRTTLATATRGNGGQNEIGPELFEALGVLRTEELAAVHRFDGAEQYFTRAVDFGFSFSVDETFEKWGRDEILGDYVHLIRMIRPDVIVGMSPLGTGGGQHHQASAILSREAFKAAGDPTRYSEQLTAGLRPWQPKKYYFNTFITGFGPEPLRTGKTCRVNLAVYDPLLGRTYSEIGTEARSMHKCQGTGQLLALPGPAATTYQLVESTIPGQADRDETSLFDGVDTSLDAIARLAGAAAPAALRDGLADMTAAVTSAQATFDRDADAAAVPPLIAGLHATRRLRGRLREMPLENGPRQDVDNRLRQKEDEFQQALLFAAGVRIDALADDGVVVPGQKVKVAVVLVNHGSPEMRIKRVQFAGFDDESPCLLTAVTANTGRGGRGGREDAPPPGPVLSALVKDIAARCEVTLTIPSSARVTEPYWHRQGDAGRYTFDPDAPFGLPFRPTPFLAVLTLGFPGGGEGGDEEVVERVPVEYRYEGNIFSGEKRSELLVVPALSVRLSPEIAIIPADSIGKAQPLRASAVDMGGREIRATVVNDSPGPADCAVRLQLPPGWKASPAQSELTFSRQDESQTVRFAIKPAPGAAPGEYHVRVIASSGGRDFDRGFQTIEYPHIRRQHIYHDADVRLKVIRVRTAPNLTVGYVAGVGDEVPAAIEQLGVKLEFITPEDLAWGNLARFNTIVTGVRAYERRADLRANNRRLLDYVRTGGTLVVQYNKFEFNEAQYGPYPAKVSANRVTDELAPVTVLVPGDPLFTYPNEIGPSAWQGWVQERGLYFLGDRDSRYRDLVSLEDPFPNNKGEKKGALVETTYGQGHWIYVGLGLWRQLPAGTDGAYQLLANLISVPRAPETAPKRATAGAPASPAGKKRSRATQPE